jgi:hypothetical protein
VRIAEGPSYFYRSGESLAEERLEREKLAGDKTDVAAQLARVKLEQRLHEEILRHTESLSMTHTTPIKSKDKGGSAASLSAARSAAGDAPSEGDYVVEVAKNNLSKCRECGNTIEKDALWCGPMERRIDRTQLFFLPQWHHVKCVDVALSDVKDVTDIMFTKVIKTPVETELQDITTSIYGFAPKIQRIDDNIVQMDFVEGQCLGDIYTDDPTMIPDTIWSKIEHMLTVLFEREGIEYVYITSYNFLEDAQGQILKINFGDAYCISNKKGEPVTNWFCARCWLASLARSGIPILPEPCLCLMQAFLTCF